MIIIAGVAGGGKATSNSSSGSDKSVSTSKSNDTSKKTRKVTDESTDLTEQGTFTGGKDIPVGLYDATAADGTGNFTITRSDGNLDINEILGVEEGQGVEKTRVNIKEGDKIELQSINKAHFEPVTSSFVTSLQTTNIYAGDWVIGEDVYSGRYIVTPGSGSGNFVVYDATTGLPKTNEILGTNGVKQVTVDLSDGDRISVSSLNQVTLTPSK